MLVDGGVLVLETPDCSHVTDIQTLQHYRLIHPLDHINAFTPDTLRRLASQLGFVEIKRPITVMACDWRGVVKRVGKKLLRPMLKPTTQLYFLKI